METRVKKDVFSLYEWEVLKKYHIANKRTLISLRNAVNNMYYSTKERANNKLESEDKKNLWYACLTTVYQNFFHCSKENRDERFITFCSAITKINNRLKTNKSDRERERTARKLELVHHERQLFLPGISPDNEEYEDYFDEYKEKILFD